MEIWTPLQFAKEGRFAIGSNIINYLQRPKDLEDKCNICFFINFKQARLPKKLKDSGEFYSFLETHPSKDIYCIIDRENSDSVLPEVPFCLLPDLSKVGPIFPQYNQQFTVAQHLIRERYAMFVCLLIFPFRILSDIKVDNSFMKYYQTKITEGHENIARYKHIMKNIQDCYNATCLKRHKDELDSKTTMYTDDQSSNAINEVEEEPEYDLDMGLLDEAQDHDDDHLMFTEEITEESVFMHNQMGQGAHGRNADDATNVMLPDSTTRFHLMELSFKTDTLSRPNPQNNGGPHRSVMLPNGTKESIIEWGYVYGLDDKQQGAFEVATSNFVLTYHIEAATSLQQL
eukprot:scaffold123655_cov62-Attheya_sp.AAC.1